MPAASICTFTATACQECERQLGLHVVRLASASSADTRRWRGAPMSRRQTLGAAHHQAAALRRSREADDSGSAAQSASSWEDEALASAEPGVSCDDETAPLRRAAEPEHADYDIGVRAALAVLFVYKAVISPLLPKACRFLPTCSSYAVEAYQEFGFVRGTVLTAWRVVRCNPWGASGYDPPRWPPPRFGETAT